MPCRTPTPVRAQPVAASPSIPLCFATGNGGAGCSHICVIHPARIARNHDNASRPTTAAGPRHPLCCRNGGGGGLRLAVNNSTNPPLARPRYALAIRTSAAQPARQAPLNPGLSRWLLPLVPVRTSHRFATTNASTETNARRTTNAPEAATFGRSHDAVVAPASPSPRRLARLLQPLECALPLRFGKDKVS